MIQNIKLFPKVFIILLFTIILSKLWIEPANLYISEIEGANFLKTLFTFFKLNSYVNIYVFKFINLLISFAKLFLFYSILKRLIKDDTSALLSTLFFAMQPVSLLFGNEITFHNFEFLVILSAACIGIIGLEKNKHYYILIVGILMGTVYNGSGLFVALNCIFISLSLKSDKRISIIYYIFPLLLVRTFVGVYFDESYGLTMFGNFSFQNNRFLTLLKTSFEMLIIPFVMLYLIYEKRFQFEITNKYFTYILIGFLPLGVTIILKQSAYLEFSVFIAILFVSVFSGTYIKYAYTLNKNYKMAIVIFLFSNLAFANYLNYYQSEHKAIINNFVSAISNNIEYEHLGTRVASDNVALAKFATKVKAEFSCIIPEKCNHKNCEKFTEDKIETQYFDYLIFSSNMSEEEEINLRREKVINNYRLIYQEEIKSKITKPNSPIRKFLIYKALRLM